MAARHGWIDFHVHLGHSRDGAWLTFPGIQKVLTGCGVTQAVLFPVDEAGMGPSYERMNEKVLDAVRGDRRFIGFCRLNPKNRKQAFRELERCRRSGIRGVKLHPRSEAFDSHQAEDLVAEIEKARLPVILHTGHEPTARPLLWERVFRRHRKIPFVLAHGGKDAFREAIAVARRNRHVWVETSTLSYWRTGVILKSLTAARMVFGSDLPYSHPAVERVKLDLLTTATEQKKIYWDNPREILGE